jgi:hypothetical protein
MHNLYKFLEGGASCYARHARLQRAMRAWSAFAQPPSLPGGLPGARKMRASKPSPPFAWTCLLSCARLERVLRASHIAWGRTLERFPLPLFAWGLAWGAQVARV